MKPSRHDELGNYDDDELEYMSSGVVDRFHKKQKKQSRSQQKNRTNKNTPNQR